MKTLKTLLAVALIAAPLAAQSGSRAPILTESFDFSTTGAFPPSGWSTQDAGTAPYVWTEASLAVLSVTTMTFDAAGHEYSAPGIQCESYLLTPSLDFSAAAAPSLVFDHDVYWILYFSHTGSIGGGLANGVSTVEASTDGGVTWSAPLWTFAGLADGLYLDEFVDCSAYAGNSNVTLAWHYSGDFAQDWCVDDVEVDDGGVGGPSISVTAGAPGGSMTFAFAGYTPSGIIAAVYGPAGAFVVPGGACAGLALGLLPINASSPILIGADGAGAATVVQNVPAAGAGLSVQAVDVASCTGSGVIVL